MKRKFFKFAALALSAIVVLSTAGASKISMATPQDVEVWGAYNTLKVLQSKHTYQKLDAALIAQMGKGETESAQLVITPKANVESYNLTVGELVNEKGDKFPAEDITVFIEKYILVKQKSYGQANTEYPAGYTPDMLLPLDMAIKAKENNIIGGNNQGLMVEFKTHEKTPAGKYQGSAKLTIDGAEQTLPVSLDVWNIDLTKVSGRTAFGLEIYTLMSGEFDNSDAMYRNYYETLLNEYKVNAYYLPNWDLGGEEMTKSILYYWDNPNFNSYNIPLYKKALGVSDITRGELKNYLMAISLASVPEKLLFEKAYIYPWMVDEPASEAQIKGVNDIRHSVDVCVEEVLQELSSNGYFDKFDGAYKTLFENTLRNLPFVVTTKYNANIADSVNSFCPPIQYYNTPTEQNAYKENAKRLNGEQWVYTCLQPIFPYPTHHLDDYLIGSRAIGWIQQAYDISGYLYYSTSIYTDFNAGKHINPYEDPVRFKQGAAIYPGDGYLLYPAIKYNADKPFGSIRLTAIRDGQEDKDLIDRLDKAYANLGEKYGATGANSKSVLNPIYQTIFNGSVYKTEDQAMFTARQNIASLYDMATSETGLLISNLKINNDSFETEFFANSGYEVKVNGEAASGISANQGKKYSVKRDYKNPKNYLTIELTKDGKTEKFEIFISDLIVKTTDFSKGLGSESISLSAESLKVNNTANSSVDLTMVSKGTTLVEKLSFVPQFIFKKEMFKTPMNKLHSINFVIENTSAINVDIQVHLMAGSKKTQISKFTIKAGASLKIELLDIDLTNWNSLSLLDAISFSLNNIDSDNNLLPNRTLKIYDVYYSAK